MTWGITNGDGTICNTGMMEAEARSAAQRRADEHGETFFIFLEGREYPEGKPNYGLGEPVEPTALEGKGRKR